MLRTSNCGPNPSASDWSCNQSTHRRVKSFGCRSCQVLRFPDTGRFKGIAFITFADDEGYKNALDCNGAELDGQVLKVCVYPNMLISMSCTNMRSACFWHWQLELEVTVLHNRCRSIAAKPRLRSGPVEQWRRRTPQRRCQLRRCAQLCCREGGHVLLTAMTLSHMRRCLWYLWLMGC